MGIARQVVGLVDDHDLELLPGRLIDLLCLGHLFEQVLYDNSVIVAHIGRCYLEVIDRSDDVEFELAAAARLEDAGVDLDFLDTGTV